ncbi:glycosyltransferase family 2 protein [Xanthobacter pseudotagetidis]|uniref:glycosyltransferase family 2 protein n=1 Tax=Xanthobacter pseudotagetidis TaxID=3119911 RepID=UPI00372AF180
MKIAICAIVRDEAPYVLEWVAHHRALGFDHIFVFDNESRDGTSELLDSLSTLAS